MSQSVEPPIVLVHRRPEGETEVVLVGRLDIGCVGRLRNAVVRAADESNARITVDASRVTAVDPVGLRTLVACRRLAAAIGIDMILWRPSPPLQARLRRIGLDRTLTVAGCD
ncbi:MAG TPA: STAS domain-containing protein [Mycobacteriales bacterium]|nr:STAS domain-containing protein [Mycobacteriales bacterium]